MKKELQNSNTPVRSYPKLYEKIIPVAIILIVAVLLVLLVITVGVAMGAWSSPA